MQLAGHQQPHQPLGITLIGLHTIREDVPFAVELRRRVS
jgi:hypothetical protein